MNQPKPRQHARSSNSGRSIELAKIHMAAAHLGLICQGDDSTYRDMLWSIGRVRSAKDLDAGGRVAVLNHLRGCGWVDRKSATRYTKGTPAALIRWLWTQLHEAGAVDTNTDRALRRYIATHLPDRPLQADEIAPQHLDRESTTMIIEQLKKWLARTEREQAKP